MSPLLKGKRAKHSKRRGRADSVKERRKRTRLRGLNLTMRQWRRWFSVASILLVVLMAVAGGLAYRHFKDYPGIVDRDSIRSEDRGADYIKLSWEETLNTDKYKVYIKDYDTLLAEAEAAAKEQGSNAAEGEEALSPEELVSEEWNKGLISLEEGWTIVDTGSNEVKVEELEEDTTYSFVIRASNSKHDSMATEPRNYTTKKSQDIEVDKHITKLTSSKPFKINASAETPLIFESSNEKVAVVDPETNEISLTGAGKAKITVKAAETSEYESDKAKVEIEVIEAEPVNAGGASARIIYHLDSDNCEVVKQVTGAGGAVIPQGLAYTGDKYIISYGMGSPNRIVSFDVDGDGKEVSVPKVSLGHPNGFTYADENSRCYCVKGWSSKAVTYEPTSDSYGSVSLAYGCSGIGYDRKEKLLYTCSRTAMVAYDISEGYKVVNRTGVVKHSGQVYTQDCGGHAGILLRCLSGSSKHGINYIDLYDMKNGKYLGTFSCDLSEVESCIVNKDGYLEILANNTSGTDYIWRTNINIETIGEGL